MTVRTSKAKHLRHETVEKRHVRRAIHGGLTRLKTDTHTHTHTHTHTKYMALSHHAHLWVISPPKNKLLLRHTCATSPPSPLQQLLCLHTSCGRRPDEEGGQVVRGGADVVEPLGDALDRPVRRTFHLFVHLRRSSILGRQSRYCIVTNP